VSDGETFLRRKRCDIDIPGRYCVIGDLIAAAVGRNVDRRDGEGGTLGALAGVATWKVARRVVPAAIVLGGAALGARYLARKFRNQPASA
jgi:hypothetical protein